MSDLKRLKCLGYLAPLSNYHSNGSSVRTGRQRSAQYYPDMPCVLWNHGLLGIAGVNKRGQPKKFWPRNPNGTTFNNKKLKPAEIPVFGLTPPGFPECINVVDYVFAASRYKRAAGEWSPHYSDSQWIASWKDPFGKEHRVDLYSIGGRSPFDFETTYRETPGL